MGRENANNMKNDDEYAFAMQHRTYFKLTCKRIMDLKAKKLDFFPMMAFDTCKGSFPCNVLWVNYSF